MQARILISFFCSVITITASAQFGKWKLYIAEKPDSLYNLSAVSFVRKEMISYPLFYPFEQSLVILNHASSTEKMSRAGIILNAKTITVETYNVEFFLMDGLDSLRIFANIEANETYHGRSALTSVLNLFSKEEDKDPQDEPYTLSEVKKIKGFIEYKNQTAYFKNDSLILGSEILIMKGASKLVHKKNSRRIKKANKNYHASRLMLGDTCVAALDAYDYPKIFYSLKNMSALQQHFIAAYFILKHVHTHVKEN